MKYLGDRQLEWAIARYLRLLVRMAAHDGDPVVRTWTIELIEKVEWLIKTRGCSRHDILEHLNTCVQGSTRLAQLPNEDTPGERPSALAAELEPEDTRRWRLPLWRRVTRWRPWR